MYWEKENDPRLALQRSKGAKHMSQLASQAWSAYYQWYTEWFANKRKEKRILLILLQMGHFSKWCCKPTKPHSRFVDVSDRLNRSISNSTAGESVLDSMSAISDNILKNWKPRLHSWKPKKNDPFLFKVILPVYWNYF